MLTIALPRLKGGSTKTTHAVCPFPGLVESDVEGPDVGPGNGSRLRWAAIAPARSVAR